MHDGLLKAGSGIRRLFGLTPLVGLLVACSEASSASSSEGTASHSQAVVYGEVSGPEDDAVVQTVAKDGGVIYRCTGTLVAPNLVITARHCVSNFVELSFTCTPEGELTPESKGGTMGALYAPSAITVRSGGGPNPPFAANATRIFAGDTPSICRNDIALIVLDRMLDLPIVPMRLFKGTQRSEILKVVGYGVDETDFFGIRHMRDDLVVSEVGPSSFNPSGDNIPPRTLLTEGPALCIGDSGGPAFVESTAIAGVWSQVVGDCKASGARNFFTVIAPFTNGLVLPAFEAAGAEPWLEGNSGPGLNTGGTVGTGGGNAGDTSTAGDSTTEGGTPGTGGSGATGGSLSTGGLVGTGGDEPAAGAPAFGGSSSSGASGVEGTLRKKGGCTCGVVGAPSGGSELLLLPLAALALLRRRRAQLVR